MLDEVRNLADFIIDTSGFNVHELRAYMQAKFGQQEGDGAPPAVRPFARLLPQLRKTSRKTAVPLRYADLVFDVRIACPTPHFVPEFLTHTANRPPSLSEE